jgi:peroxiredoxin
MIGPLLVWSHERLASARFGMHEYITYRFSVGSIAPDFELKDQHGAKVSLSSFKGNKNVVVLFIPFAFTGTCTGELCAIRDDSSGIPK